MSKMGQNRAHWNSHAESGMSALLRKATVCHQAANLSLSARSRHKQRSKEYRQSIISSATNCNELGTSMPSNLAACALMTNSNLLDCKTGRSVGFAPLRICPV